MPETTIKDEARRLVERLPEDATWEDLQYEIFFRQAYIEVVVHFAVKSLSRISSDCDQGSICSGCHFGYESRTDRHFGNRSPGRERS